MRRKPFHLPQISFSVDLAEAWERQVASVFHLHVHSDLRWHSEAPARIKHGVQARDMRFPKVKNLKSLPPAEWYPLWGQGDQGKFPFGILIIPQRRDSNLARTMSCVQLRSQLGNSPIPEALIEEGATIVTMGSIFFPTMSPGLTFRLSGLELLKQGIKLHYILCQNS